MNGPAITARITSCRLFVHEQRCMAALGHGEGMNAPLNERQK
jgi:hypothetical protein